MVNASCDNSAVTKELLMAMLLLSNHQRLLSPEGAIEEKFLENVFAKDPWMAFSLLARVTKDCRVTLFPLECHIK